jgi:hypothetical protein
MYNEGEHPRVLNCVFTANRAVGQPQGWGGAILNGYFTYPEIAGCVMSRNEANRGGGVFNMIFSEPRIVNSTIVANRALATADAGGGVYSYQQTVCVIENSVVAFNEPTELEGSFTGVRHSLVRTGYAGPGGVHVLDVDPGFIERPSAGPDSIWFTEDDVEGDLRPAPGSVCIDAGDSDAAAPFGTTDVTGAPRFVDDVGVPDSGVGEPPIVDMGAYEFQGRSCLADFNTDGAVNSQDFFDFLGAFFKGAADFNRDGGVNSQDFFDFLAMFFAGC